MKYIMTLCLFVSCLHRASSEGMEFHHGTWAEVLAASKESGKLIFVDAYTTWCGPCKMMSAKTFPQKAVGDFYNPNFINVKIDMEKGEGLQISGTYSVSAFPTLLYIDGEGKLVHKAVGYLDPEKFISSGKVALKKNDKSMIYAKEYESGKRDFTTVFNYVRALNMAGKSSLKIANEYINNQKDLTTPENLKFLMEATTESDSRIFDLFIKHKDKLILTAGSDVVQSKILSASNKSVLKAIEFKSIEVLSSAQSKVKLALPKAADQFEFESNLAYFTGMADAEGLLKSMKKLPSVIEQNVSLLNELAIVVEKSFGADAKLLGLTEQFLSKWCTIEAHPEYQFTMARIYALNHKNDKAVKALDQAIQSAKSKNMDAQLMEQFKLQLQRS